MRTARTISVTVCLLLVASCARSPEWYPPRSIHSLVPVQVHFNSDAGRGESLYVTLRTEDDEELLFGVDTGSPITTLDRSLARRLGGLIETQRIDHGYLGQRSIGVYRAPKLYLGETSLFMGDVVWTDDLSHMSSRPMKGILGMDCLRHYCVQFDFASCTMKFLNSDAVKAENLGKAFALSITKAGVSIKTSFVGSKNVAVGIDTGEYLDGALQADLLEGAIGGGRDGRRLRKDPGALALAIRIPEGRFDGATYPDLVLRENPRGVNLLGLRFLARHVVTFDFPHRTMYLKQVSVEPLQ